MILPSPQGNITYIHTGGALIYVIGRLQTFLLPYTHVQGGKVIVFVIVVVSTKITRSLELGIFASYNCHK